MEAFKDSEWLIPKENRATREHVNIGTSLHNVIFFSHLYITSSFPPHVYFL